MSFRPWSGLAAVAALLVAGCSAPPPPAPPTYPSLPHACLMVWGQSALGLKNALVLLNRPVVDGGLGHAWALHAETPAVYDSLVRLKASLETALEDQLSPTIARIDGSITVSPAVGLEADVVNNLLESDRILPLHAPLGFRWLSRPNTANPALPLATELLAAVREAVDM